MGQGDECGFVYNPPVLPDPPSFNGSTKSERTFIHQYNKYQDQVNALQLNGSRPFVMAVSACMDIFTKNRVAMWDMANRDYCGDTEAAWAAWFGKVFEQESQDLEVLKKRLTTAIRFDTPILDADSRIGTMLDNLMRALECDEQAWVLDQESKTVVDIMVKGIKPLGLQMTVQHQLALQHKKPLKTNVCRFVDWLRVHTAGYHLYAPVDDEKTSSPPAAADAAPSRPSKPGRSEDSSGISNGPPRGTPVPEQDCASENHKVVNCPKCAPGQCERLLKEQINKWESARNKKVTKLQGSANKSLGREAKIEGIVFLTTTLLDTGSDEPSVIQPYGQAPTPSRAVMEQLGFSEDELLSHALTSKKSGMSVTWTNHLRWQQIGSAKKAKLTRVQLTAVGCDVGHLACFDKIKKDLLPMVPMVHPQAGMMVCLYTDASESFSGAIATQVPFEHLALPAPLLAQASVGLSWRRKRLPLWEAAGGWTTFLSAQGRAIKTFKRVLDKGISNMGHKLVD
ncbi:hypothetical protein AaE_013850 [Aphanomyces astaci]|uniref:Reverse transcriptase/retrotransposon-derived protein RNase H-like domain-containing protein n=1 Tax=Aphanomyces astaci TaxID=112090 RepID=A0A6A4Z922_APHAT|nr:hypothetical protein AaE_013850 [Aphanomyces astaci]